MVKNVYYEARGEPVKGKEAVVHVLLNRIKMPNYPSTVCGNTFMKAQFSWVGSVGKMTDKKSVELAKAAVYNVISGNSSLGSFPASHFYNPSAARPAWAKKCTPVAKIGKHSFYKC